MLDQVAVVHGTCSPWEPPDLEDMIDGERLSMDIFNAIWEPADSEAMIGAEKLTVDVFDVICDALAEDLELL